MTFTSPSSPAPAPSLPSTILAVDDSPLLLEVVVEVLTTAGYQVYTADSGEAALAVVAATLPDLILLDIRMQGMDGLELCQRLKGGEATREIPVILISGFAEVQEWVMGLQLGAADYIIKPFRQEELLSRVKIHLALRRANRSLSEQAALLRQANEELQGEIAKRRRMEEELRNSLDMAERAQRTLLRTVEDQKRTEQALRDSEMELCRAQEITHIGHFRCNPATGAVEGSDELARIFGLRRDEFTLANFLEVVQPDQREFVESVIKEAVAQGAGYDIELSLRLRDGRRKVVNVIAQVVAAPLTGQPLLMGTVQDISERKRAEGENAELQARLNQAQKMEAIGVLAGGIAHDFNNILGVILGYADMAREDAAPDSPYAKDLDRVLTSAHRAKELVRQILAFSRQTTIEPMAIKIQPMVKEALKMLRASIPTTITIKENIRPDCGVVMADPTHVHQIVMNLCTNAFHAMEKSGGVLSVAVKTTCVETADASPGPLPPPGEYVELTVSDTGSGIGPDILGKIFDPYFTTKEVGRGTGMGLSIAHGIINSYGGAITVESAVGRGTTFHVYFPMVREEAMVSAAEEETPRGRGRILFIDDEVLLAEMGEDLLKRLGYTVSAYSRGSEALAAFMEDPAQFDLVVTDQTMPGMTGTELAGRLLAIRPELPIILCTGYSHVINEDSAKAIGIREYALKPLTKASIGQLIRKHLAGSEVG